MRHMAYISSIILATTVGWFFGLMTSPYATSKEPRFPQLTMEQLSDKQKPLGEQIVKVSRVGLAGPYNPMLRSPVFGQKMFDLLYYLRWQTSVPLKLSCDTYYRATVAVAGGVVCSRTARHQGRVVAGYHR
jgi:4-carboxymuconolactone decarboxylase